MSDTRSGPRLHRTTIELACGKNFAAVSTLLPNGEIFKIEFLADETRTIGRVHVRVGLPQREGRGVRSPAS